MGTESNVDERVTCRSCGATYVPDFARDFYPDGEDPKVGRCEGCMMRSLFQVNTKEPHVLPSGHLETVCKFRQGEATCSFLVIGGDGSKCGKDSSFEKMIRQRRSEGTMGAKGDNCSGPPNFTSTET